MEIKWYAIHLPIYVIDNEAGPITKEPISICSSVSEGFDLTKLQSKFGAANVVELPYKPTVDVEYNKTTRKLEKL